MKTKRMQAMCDRLFSELKGWILKEGENNCVTISQIWDKVYDNAPKTVRDSGLLMREVVVRLWDVDHDYTVEECEMASADLNDRMIECYN